MAVAKVKLVPKSADTILKKELQAASIGVQLLEKYLGDQIKKAFIWTDSTSVLGWVKNPPKGAGIFVSHRVLLILNKTDKNQWHWVSTKENPADIGTRGLKARYTTRTYFSGTLKQK